MEVLQLKALKQLHLCCVVFLNLTHRLNSCSGWRQHCTLGCSYHIFLSPRRCVVLSDLQFQNVSLPVKGKAAKELHHTALVSGCERSRFKPVSIYQNHHLSHPPSLMQIPLVWSTSFHVRAPGISMPHRSCSMDWSSVLHYDNWSFTSFLTGYTHCLMRGPMSLPETLEMDLRKP